jgi:hypothetical protein
MPLPALIPLLVPVFSKALEKIIPDKEAREKRAHELATSSSDDLQEIMLAQLAVNKAEAESGSLWKGGWRPGIGWTCGAAFALNFLLFPLVQYALAIAQAFGAGLADLPDPPVLDMATMMPVMLGMLGLGTLRTGEKIKGVAAR